MYRNVAIALKPRESLKAGMLGRWEAIKLEGVNYF